MGFRNLRIRSRLITTVSLLVLMAACVFMFLMSAGNIITREQVDALGFPVICIDTEANKAIKSKEKYVKASFSIGGGKSLDCKIRGHGNSTWNNIFTQKKPYLVKLDREESLLGMDRSRKWLLIANSFDRSMLRNAYVEYLSHNVWNSMKWNPQSRFVSLYLNRKFMGLYCLSEKVEISDNRIEFEGEGFLAEVDSHKGRPYSFWCPGVKAQFNIRQPDSLSQEKYESYARIIQDFSASLLKDDFRGRDGWMKFCNVESFVDWYLISEFSKNYDANFFNSVFMNYDYGTKKLSMGPVWDHDIAFGNNQKAASDVLLPVEFNLKAGYDMEANNNSAMDYDGFLINQFSWFRILFTDEEFVSLVKERWAQRRPELEKSIVWLEEQGRLLDDAGELNNRVWHVLGSDLWPRAPGFKSRTTYASEVDFLLEWTRGRMKFLDSMFLDSRQ